MCLLPITANAAKQYRVGVIPKAPFAYVHAHGYNGISVDLWRKLAKSTDTHFTFVEADTYMPKAIEGLKQGQYDVLIGAFSDTSKRLKDLRFSRPYFLTRLEIIENTHKNTFFHIFKDIILDVWGICLLLSFVVLFIMAHIHYYFEHQKPKSKYYKKCLSIPESYYHYLITFFSQSSIEYKTNTLTGRFLNIIAILLSIFIFSTFVGVITTAMTISASDLVYKKGN